MAILTEKPVFQSVQSRYYFGFFLVCLVILSFLSIHFLTPFTIQGDGVSYAQSMQVLRGGAVPADFVPNRLLTTFLGLEAVIMLSKIFGSIMVAWIALNLFFYFLLTIVFYKILKNIFQSDATASIGGLFLASNYALLVFGLNYLMDIGGWTFYMLSIFYTLKYAKFGERKDIISAACLAGIGGLFKEYALLAIIPIACFLIYENRRSFADLVKKSLAPAIFALLPLALIYIFIYVQFHYTYATWFATNKTYYIYHSRIIEYIKSSGSLVNILGIVFVGGLIAFWKEMKTIDNRMKVFIFSLLFSVLPIFLWPAITQRILFITVPFIILISCFFVKKYEHYWYLFLTPLVLYACASFFMNSVILPLVNLPF